MGIRMLLLRGTFRAVEWGVRENLGVGSVVYIPLGVGHFNGSVVVVQSMEGSGLIKIVYSSKILKRLDKNNDKCKTKPDKLNATLWN